MKKIIYKLFKFDQNNHDRKLIYGAAKFLKKAPYEQNSNKYTHVKRTDYETST